MNLRVLIVDDEPLARERVRVLLEKEPDVEIIGECSHGREAVDVARRLKPDLMILDIQMPELDGFQVLRELGNELPEVVFVTAFDQYAVKAFEAHALDYLLKPFKPARLREAVERARQRMAEPGADELRERVAALLREEAARPRYMSRLAIKDGDRVQFVRVAEIDWIEASGNYVIVHVGSARHLMRETLAALEDRLSPQKFLRLSRSALVNVEQVEAVQPADRADHVAVLKSGVRVPVTRGVREIQERMKFL
jgi:two-component system LytT family response regulator